MRQLVREDLRLATNTVRVVLLLMGSC